MIKKWLKRISLVLLLALVFGLGIWLTHAYYSQQKVEKEEQTQVLLEKIKTVAKLVTVEGYFSEIYDYKDYWKLDLSILRKKALLRVKAKVSVGYDLSKMKIEALPEKKLIVISHIPDPEILSIDHDIDYYDIQEGMFNSFSAKDYTELNANAKNFIRARAMESDLFLAAEEQSNQLQDMIRFMVEAAGWKLQFKSRYEESELDSLVQ